jgi:hypothetical protein
VAGRIHGLCQQCSYKGQVTVQVHVNHSRTVIRTTKGFSAAFKSHFVPPEKYELDVFWPYSSHTPIADDEEELQAGTSIAARKCLVRTENGWFKDWRPVLRAAIINKKVGWLTLDDWIEYQMKPLHSEEPPAPWGNR